MTLGGTSSNKLTKLYSLDINHPVPACLKSLRELPDSRRYAAGSALGISASISSPTILDMATDCNGYAAKQIRLKAK